MCSPANTDTVLGCVDAINHDLAMLKAVGDMMGNRAEENEDETANAIALWLMETADEIKGEVSRLHDLTRGKPAA